MTEAFWSDPKPDLAECPCGCLVVGRPRVRAWQDGLPPHVRGCPCVRCRNSRHVGRARKRESKVAKAAGGTRDAGSGRLSGVDGRSGLWCWEETSNVSITRGFKRWIEGKGVQQKIFRLMERSGVKRALILSWDGKPRWVITKFEDWADQVKSEAS